ncbi:hypothetical protein BamMC406_5159 [Burkholderia ambifaria MC40-6]|uniref:Uncharacterized protein n=2 Tax=Burkholderia ambifaria TaxID=152480 RepID=B1Z0Q2_BURA4|nr:hypothetical protein BamMC406_5159 [Burkholderia ambifaria MC40-6]
MLCVDGRANVWCVSIALRQICIATAIIGVGISIVGCRNLSVNESPIRAKRDFLMDVKTVADIVELSDVDSVSSRLRVVYRVKPSEAVFDAEEKSVIGYRVEAIKMAASKEYRADGRYLYGMFWPTERSFTRVLLALPVNVDMTCVTPSDLIEVFGDVVKRPEPHGNGWGYVYTPERVGVKATFGFLSNHCLASVTLFQNNSYD